VDLIATVRNVDAVRNGDCAKTIVKAEDYIKSKNLSKTEDKAKAKGISKNIGSASQELQL